MVLSYALAKRSGKDYETLLRERLLVPLGMNETYVARRPPQVRLAQGHFPNATPAVPWDFHPDMAGVGGVRATLPDMLRYLEGQLGTRESAITPALAQTQKQVASVGGHRMGMNWNPVHPRTATRSSRMKAAPAVIRRSSASIARRSAPSSCSATRRSPPSAALPARVAPARSVGARRRAARRRDGRRQADRRAGRQVSPGGRPRHRIAAQGQRIDHPGRRSARIRNGLRQRGRLLSAQIRRAVAAEAQGRRHLSHSPGFRAVPCWRPSASARRRRSQANGRRRKRNSRTTSATIR